MLAQHFWSQESRVNKKTPEGVYAGCIGVSKNYLEWYWKVERGINNKCVQERRRCSAK